MSHMWLPAKWSIRWPRLLNHSAFKSSSLNRSVTRMHSSCHPINICHFERCSSEYYVLHNHSPHTNYDKYTSKFHPRYWAYDYRRREERSYIGTFIGTLPPRWLSHSCRLICTALKRYGHLHMPENYNQLVLCQQGWLSSLRLRTYFVDGSIIICTMFQWDWDRRIAMFKERDGCKQAHQASVAILE